MYVPLRRTPRRFSTSPLTIALGLTFAASIASAASPIPAADPSGGMQALNLIAPLRAIITDGDPHVTTLRVAPDLYETVRLHERVVMTSVPLSDIRRIDLVLRRFDVFTSDAVLLAADGTGQHPAPRPDVALYTGSVRGEEGSGVFLAVTRESVSGLIRTPGGDSMIATSLGDDPRTVVYDIASLPDGRINLLPMTCGTPDGPAGGERPPGERSTTPAAPRRLRLAVDCDYEFYQRFGQNLNNASAYAATIIGAVSQIYSTDINTDVRISFLRVWTTPDDPWTQTGAHDQLAEFMSYWLANGDAIDRHAAHFLTTRSLTGAGGVAYLGAICTDWAYGLSGYLNGFFPLPLQDNRPQNWDVMVVAHELGHNIGAPHTHSMSPPIDTCGLGDCSGAAAGTIMSYCHTCSGGMTNIALNMHPRIINERILPYLGGLGCNVLAPGACRADFNGDGTVNSADLSVLLFRFGSTVTPWSSGDTNGDGTVNSSDLSVFLNVFGTHCD